MGTWQAVWDAVASDFADLPDVAQAARVGVRLLFAAVLGGLIGYDREQKGKAAGLRTHMLVALGAALIVVVVQQQPGGTPGDVARAIQGLVAGVGFLGAGTILNGRREGEIKGLTTAAGIWLTAAIGVAAGLGRESTALLATLLALAILALMPRFEAWLFPAKADAPRDPPAPEPPAPDPPAPRRAGGKRASK